MQTRTEQPVIGLHIWVSRLHYLLAAITFLLAAVHLFMIRGRDFGALLLCLLPPLFAWASLRSPHSLLSSRRLAGSFLLAIAIGDIIARFDSLFPGMNDFSDLPRSSNRILSWYVLVYLLYAFVIFPPILFIRPLIQRRRGEKPYFTRFTCYLGLFTWLILGPAMVGTCWVAFVSRWLNA